MKDRKLMVEVTDEEYELLKKGIKLSDMKTEDLIYELISRSDERTILSKDLLTGTPDMKGRIYIPNAKFEFNLESTRSPRVSAIPSTADPLNPASPIIKSGMINETLNMLFGRIDKDIADKGPNIGPGIAYPSRRK